MTTPRTVERNGRTEGKITVGKRETLRGKENERERERE